MKRTSSESPAPDMPARHCEETIILELLTLYRREGESAATQAKLRELRRLRHPGERVH